MNSSLTLNFLMIFNLVIKSVFKKETMNKDPKAQTAAQKTYKFKLVLLGSLSVGKTQLSLRYIRNRYGENGQATIMPGLISKTTQFEQKQIEVTIFDTCGQERFNALPKIYYRDTAGVIFVYDITNRESFFNLETWLGAVKQQNGCSQANKILFGNKCDLEEKRAVTYEEGKEFADRFGMEFFETSAKEDIGVVEGFNRLLKQILQMVELERQAPESKDKIGVGLGKGNRNAKQRKFLGYC